MPRRSCPGLLLVRALVLLLAAGCTHYAPKPITPARTLHEFEDRRLTDEAVLSAVRARTDWNASSTAGPMTWGRAQFLVAALELNPALAEARAKLLQVGAGERTARALQNPTVSLASEYDLSRAAESPWLWGLGTSVLLDTFRSRGLRISLAQAGLRGARADFDESIWTVRRDLRAALLGSVLTTRRIAALEADVRQRTDLLRLVRARVAAGESARADSLQAQLEVTRAAAALDAARATLIDFDAKVAAALGVPYRARAEVTATWNDLEALAPIPPTVLEPLRERALLSRADMARAIADYDAKELDLKQQASGQYLQASLGPGYTYDHGVRKLTFGASVSLPIFNQNQGPIAEALAAREVAGQHVVAAQAAILAEIEAATAVYSNALEGLQRAREQRVTSDAIAQATQREFDADATDRPTLLAAQLTASTERLAELDALDRAQQALGQLEDALRAPVSGPETSLHLFETPERSPTP